jgi:hypothetical protein
MLLIAVVPAPAVSASDGWFKEVVDPGESVGLHSSMAIDSEGVLYIAYQDGKNGWLKLARGQEGNWTLDVVDDGGKVGAYASVAVDSSRAVHIAYYDNASLDLRYATDASGDWVIEIVDGEGQVGKGASLALDPEGSAHIAYYDMENEALRYATNGEGGWSITTLEATDGVGRTSIAVDDLGHVHISYFHRVSGLKYATDSGGAWSFTVVDVGGKGMTSSIALADGRVHITYGTGDPKLKHAVLDGGQWSVEVVDDKVGTGIQQSIAIDSLGQPRIAYLDSSSFDLRYAIVEAGAWEILVLDSAKDVGYYPSLAVDEWGTSHISHWSFNDGVLLYTRSPHSAPSAPVGLTASSGDGFVNITWSPPVSYGGLPLLEYRIIRGENTTPFASIDPEREWYNETGLTNGLAYRYRVLAVNSMGESEASEEVFAVPLSRPSPPVGLSAEAGTRFVNMTWSPSEDDGGSNITGYRISRDAPPGSSSWLVNSSDGLWYNDTSVEPGTSYQYFVWAVTETHEGEFATIQVQTDSEPEDESLGLDMDTIIIIALGITVAVVVPTAIILIRRR